MRNGLIILLLILLLPAQPGLATGRMAFDAGGGGAIYQQGHLRESLELINLYLEADEARRIGVFTGSGLSLQGRLRIWRGFWICIGLEDQRGGRRADGVLEKSSLEHDYNLDYSYRLRRWGFGLRAEQVVLSCFRTYFQSLVGPAWLGLDRRMSGSLFTAFPAVAEYEGNCLAGELRGGARLIVGRGIFLEADFGYRYAVSDELRDAAGVRAEVYDSSFQPSVPLRMDFSGFLVSFRAGLEIF